MKFNKLYESIFKPASVEEVKEREKQGKIEKFKGWMDENNIRYTVDDKGNIIDVIDIEKRDEYGQTPLLYALYWKTPEIVTNFLISKGADVNIKDKTEYTPLHYASRNNNLELVKLLIAKGANVNAKEEHGITPLNFTCSVEIKELLKSHGANE